MHAVGLNRADLSASQATYGHGKLGVPIGIEWVGEMAEVGGEARGFKFGNRVACSARTGGCGEFAVTDSRRVFKIPDTMSFVRAATIPTGVTTMHRALIVAGTLAPGESVLIQVASRHGPDRIADCEIQGREGCGRIIDQ